MRATEFAVNGPAKGPSSFQPGGQTTIPSRRGDTASTRELPSSVHINSLQMAARLPFGGMTALVAE
jgi:hypothetical protein